MIVIQLNADGYCENINDVLKYIRENWPNITNSLICDAAQIEYSTLQTWQKRGTAKHENVQLLIDFIEDQPEDWDGDPGPEVGDCLGGLSTLN